MDINRLIKSVLGETGASGGASAQGSGNAQGGAGGDVAQRLSRAAEQIPGGAMGGAAAGGLIATVLGTKTGRKLGGKALTYGGLALVGGLAYRAWRNHQERGEETSASAGALPAPRSDADFEPEGKRDGEGEDFRLTLISAMISAAKADGHVDDEERARIRARIEEADLDAEAKAFLFDRLDAPADPLELARRAADEAQAMEIWLAARMAVDPDTPEERRFLERLGDALRLSEKLRARLEMELEQAAESQAG